MLLFGGVEIVVVGDGRGRGIGIEVWYTYRMVDVVKVLLEWRYGFLYRRLEEWRCLLFGRVEMLLLGRVEIVVVDDGRGKGIQG
jgi:hypothetical protein